jgi:alpha-L-rhamnosidase
MRASCLFRIVFSALMLGSFASAAALAETPNPELLTRAWKARWITHPDGPQREFGVFHFRKTFSLDSVPSRFVVHASGDNRYELFVNGERVVAGPARGDLFHWRFETLDIAPYLRAGKNVLAAVVWNYAELAPMAQMTNETGFLLQGNGAAESVVNTDNSWKCLRDEALTPIPWDPNKVSGYFVVGPGEDWNGSRYPWGWETLDYDDSGWKSPRQLDPGSPRGARDSHSRWMLVPRPIPLMEEKLERLPRVARAEGIAVPAGFLEGRGPVTVAPEAHATILLDQTYLISGYPEIIVSGGRGAKITLAYAEALVNKNRQKGNRNEIEGKLMRGFEDIFRPEGGEHHLFRPLWWRTYRYLQIDVVTRSEPVVLEDVRTLFSAYPFKLRAHFESDDPELARIWEVGWRTLRLSAHETYTDSPYYEQLQYVGDTRIECLITLYTTGDDRLVKNAIELFDESRTPEGLTQSRYTSFLPQYIPPYSLFWVGMLHDFWWYRGQPDYLRQYLQGARGVLQWFEDRLAPSGLLGRLEWWNFVDWSEEFRNGVPPEQANGQSSILSLQFAAALVEAADLEESFGSRERADHDRTLAKKITKAVYAACWDPARGLVADTPARRDFSQHANILAVLTNTVPESEQPAIMRRVLTDATLTQATFYFRYYLFRAMKKAGLGDEYLKQLDPWRQMLALGLTTWAEKPEPTRSDCHAWSAHPSFDLLATVAGIEPAAPGFAEVEIRPHLGSLRELKATLPVPQGEITVAYQRAGDRLVADVTLPEKLSGWFYWKEKRAALRPGKQHLEF